MVLSNSERGKQFQALTADTLQLLYAKIYQKTWKFQEQPARQQSLAVSLDANKWEDLLVLQVEKCRQNFHISSPSSNLQIKPRAAS